MCTESPHRITAYIRFSVERLQRSDYQLPPQEVLNIIKKINQKAEREVFKIQETETETTVSYENQTITVENTSQFKGWYICNFLYETIKNVISFTKKIIRK